MTTKHAMRTSIAGLCLCLSMGTAAIGCGGDEDDDGGDDANNATTMADGGDGAATGATDGGNDDMAADSSGDGMADGSTGAAATCETDVCATYGAAVPAVAGAIVDAAAADPMFMDDFAGLVAAGPDAVEAFKTSLANFISDAYGCSEGLYTGPSMEGAHTGLGITQEEYDAFIGLIAGVLADAGVPEADINFCVAPPLVDPAFSSTIVGL